MICPFMAFGLHDRGKETIYLHRSGPLLENGLDRPKNRYGRYGFPGFYSISISTVGVDEARVFLWRFSFLALWVVVVDISQFPARLISKELFCSTRWETALFTKYCPHRNDDHCLFFLSIFLLYSGCVCVGGGGHFYSVAGQRGRKSICGVFCERT